MRSAFAGFLSSIIVFPIRMSFFCMCMYDVYRKCKEYGSLHQLGRRDMSKQVVVTEKGRCEMQVTVWCRCGWTLVQLSSKIKMQNGGRRPGRLAHAQLCSGQRAGGIYIRYEWQNCDRRWANQARMRVEHASRTP